MLLILTKSSFSYWISHPLFVDYLIIVVGFFLTMILELCYFCGTLFVGEVDAHFAAVGELCRWEVKWTEHEMPAGASAPPDSPLRRIAIVFQFRYPPIGREHFYSDLRCASAFMVASVARGRGREENCRLNLALCTTRVITLHPSSCVYALASIRSNGKLAWTVSFISVSVIGDWFNGSQSYLHACFDKSKFLKCYQMKSSL